MLTILDLGTLRINIEAKTDAARAHLRSFNEKVKETERENNNATKLIKSAWGGVKTAIAAASKAVVGATAVVVGGFAKITKSALDSYATYEQLEGGIKKLFGKENYKIVINNAKNAFKETGMSANDYLNMTMDYASTLINSMGGNTKKAADKANMAIKDMADNVAVFGTDIERVKDTYSSLARGEALLLDNLRLGYKGTREELKRLVSDANKWRKSQGKTANLTADNFNDIVQAIHDIQEKMKITDTAAKESADTVEGSINRLRASYQNWLTDLYVGGEELDKSTGDMVQSFGVAAQKIAPILGTIATSLSEELPDAIELARPEIEKAFKKIDLEKIFSDLMNNAADGIAEFNPSEKVEVFLQNVKKSITGDTGEGQTDENSGIEGAGAHLATTIINEMTEIVGNPENWKNFIGSLFTALQSASQMYGWNITDDILEQAGFGSVQFPGAQTFGGNVRQNGGWNAMKPPWQHAEGGVFTKPTLLGRHLVGEAGSEAIIPLTPEVLGQIGAAASAYSATTNNNTTTVNNFYINDAVVNQDKEIESQFIGLMNDIKRKGGM